MAYSKPKFTAYVYKEDYNEICKMVQHYPNIETGGDLFGLWQDDETVVIQMFIGPGKDCHRTKTSFHQDVNYLAKVGAVITEKEGLCNVGEWHSHHQIGMPAPSAGDNRTVLSNLPKLGLQRFVLFIAHIKTPRGKRSHGVKIEDIELNCFMFMQGLHDHDQPIKGRIRKIDGPNPFHTKEKAEIRKLVREGAERPPPVPGDEDEKRGAKPRKSSAPSSPQDENMPPNTQRSPPPSFHTGASAAAHERRSPTNQSPSTPWSEGGPTRPGGTGAQFAGSTSRDTGRSTPSRSGHGGSTQPRQDRDGGVQYRGDNRSRNRSKVTPSAQSHEGNVNPTSSPIDVTEMSAEGYF